MKKMTAIFCSATLALGFVATAARAQATSEDKRFLAMAAQSDQNEIAVSKLAQRKTANPAVKSFAGKMVTDHTEMTAKMKPFATEWGVTPPTGPDSEHQAILNKLNGASGKDFDKQYMDAMVADHAKALDAFTNEAKTTKDTKFRVTVEGGKTKIAEHKSMATNLQGRL